MGVGLSTRKSAKSLLAETCSRAAGSSSPFSNLTVTVCASLMRWYAVRISPSDATEKHVPAEMLKPRGDSAIGLSLYAIPENGEDIDETASTQMWLCNGVNLYVIGTQSGCIVLELNVGTFICSTVSI